MLGSDSGNTHKKIFFDGKIRPIPEAGALLVRSMIEEDIPNHPGFPKNGDPYKWLAGRMNKHERTVRGWAFDWTSSSGTKPTVTDFLEIIAISKSKRPLDLIAGLNADASAEQIARNHGDTIRKIADLISEFADTIRQYSPDTAD